MATDPLIWQHREWLGMIQPVGLVVSPPALKAAQVIIDRSAAARLQSQLKELLAPDPLPGQADLTPWIDDFGRLALDFLGWGAADLQEPPESLSVALPDYGETLRATYAVPDPAGPADRPWLLLVQVLPWGAAFDRPAPKADRTGWEASPQAKFERLLRETQIPIGLAFNGSALRLTYAPRGESSGYLTFELSVLTEVAGRPILSAFHSLLSTDRLFSGPIAARLPAILAKSRDYQNLVSERLAEQVLDALWILLRGLEGADQERGATGQLRHLAETDPQHVYGGAIAVLMRLVFLLYAEERDVMPDDATYQSFYAVSGLYETLRHDAGNYPDTMDQRYGAWAWLLSLFRLVYDGGGPTRDYLPARHGELFDPEAFPFLEGRRSIAHDPQADPHMDRPDESPALPYGVPRVSDGVVFRVLDRLLLLDGERLSYRSLDVEQIGSVYEGIMGYRVEVAQAPAIGVASKPKGAKAATTVVVDLAALLAAKDRPAFLKEEANCELSAAAVKALKQADSLEAIVAALDRRVSERTPAILPPGALYLQPTEERRRSGSHYTPRSLTAPIVENTLRPIWERLGDRPTAAQILDLRVCDLAMGSGAFLVEACRQLADRLLAAWDASPSPPAPLPPGARGENPLSLAPSPSLAEGVGSEGNPAFPPHPPAPSPTGGKGEPEKSSLVPSPSLGEGVGGEGNPDYWDIPAPLRQRMTELAQQFRKAPTTSENLLWQAIRSRKLDDRKFRRQQPIGPFVVDFFCAAERLIVEVDGPIHQQQVTADRERQELIESLGLRFVRLTATEVETNLPNALDRIREVWNSPSPPAPLPPGARGENPSSLAPSPSLGEGGGGEGNPAFPPHPPAPSPTGGEGLGAEEIANEPDRLLAARRLVAQRCLYGVDKNPFAVNLAKLSLWLFTLSKDRPFTFLDHALKCGDSLVGLSRVEIAGFAGEAAVQLSLLDDRRSLASRAAIQAADVAADEDYDRKRSLLSEAEAATLGDRYAGNLAVAADFAGKTKKEREQNRQAFAARLLASGWPSPGSEDGVGDGDIRPFHWELEFPEVFDRPNPGFDAIVGNPPFAGKNTITAGNSENFLDYLKEQYPESHGNSDLVAYFFRRSFQILRVGGSFGLIATNTIAQGDTRSTGLRFICQNGGLIYNARRRFKWPGLAAVVVSVVHIWKVSNPLSWK